MKKSGALMTELEAERKFAVDPSLLPPLGEPKTLAQGYWQGTETDTSVRVVPSKGRAFLRDKSRAVGPNGERIKTWQEVPYEDGKRLLASAPKVAIKDRYKLNINGRTWKPEFFPIANHWQAETEHVDSDPLTQLPEWCMYELTGQPAGYTVNYARPMPLAEIDGLIGSLESREVVPA